MRGMLPCTRFRLLPEEMELELCFQPSAVSFQKAAFWQLALTPLAKAN
jgi:hypothetical protein